MNLQFQLPELCPALHYLSSAMGRFQRNHTHKPVGYTGYVEFLATKGEVPNVVKGEDLGKRLQNEFDGLAEVSKALGL